MGKQMHLVEILASSKLFVHIFIVQAYMQYVTRLMISDMNPCLINLIT